VIIIQDTREQQPLKFDHPWITEVRVEKLDVGDYACKFKDGHRPNVIFERKSISDLFGTFGSGHERFKKEIVRTQSQSLSLIIIIEGSLTRVLKGYDYSQIRGISVVYKLFTLWVKYGVMAVFCGSRREMSEYITHFYLACGKEYIRRGRK